MSYRTILTLQPGQTGNGMDYDVHDPVPYPFHIDAESGNCTYGRGTADLHEAPTGQPWTFIGVQWGDIQEIVYTLEELRVDPDRAFGMRPVFASGGEFFSLTEPITSARVTTVSDTNPRRTREVGTA